MIDWKDVIADAMARIDAAMGQTADPVELVRLVIDNPFTGDDGAQPVPMIRESAKVRGQRRAALTRERMARLLGQRKGDRWAGRESGRGTGTFDPATITPEQAAAVMVIVRRYVARHATVWSQYPLCPEAQDDTVARILHAIWTRDYTGSTVSAGDLAGAVWQACSLYRKTSWIGESVYSQRESRRVKREVSIDAHHRTCQGGGADNPARIAAAIEQAERGLVAPSVVNRGRKQARRERGVKRMDPVAAAAARECLCGE